MTPTWGWPAPGRQLGGQFRAGPPAQRHPGGGGQLAGQRDHRGPVRRADPPRPARPGPVPQPVQAAGGEPAPPLADRIDADAQAGGDPGIGVPAGGSQHDLRAQPVPPGRLRPPDTFLQGGALAGTQHDRHRAKQRHDSPRIRSQRRNPLPGTGS